MYNSRSGEPGNEAKRAVRLAGTVFPLAALGKAYEHHVGKALPTCSYTKNSLLTALVNCKASMHGKLSV